MSKSLSARKILLYSQLPQFRKSRRIRPQLPDLVLDGLLLDRGEESGETILEAWEFGKCCRVPYVDVAVVRLNQTPIPPGPAEAIFLALPYLILVAVFLQQLVCRKQSRNRPQPTKILYVPGQQHDLANLGDCSLSYSGVKNCP